MFVRKCRKRNLYRHFIQLLVAQESGEVNAIAVVAREYCKGVISDFMGDLV
jgi:hypothetical protein